MSTWYLHWTASTWMIINTEKLFEVMWLKDVNSSHLNIHKKSSVFIMFLLFFPEWKIIMIIMFQWVYLWYFSFHWFQSYDIHCTYFTDLLYVYNFFFFLNQKSSKCVAYDIYHGSDYHQYYKLRTTVSYFSLY